MTTRMAKCSCGQLSATIKGEPLRISVCHCLACQRRTGSVFGAQALFPASAVSISGTLTEYTRFGDEGIGITFRFCPHCGATVFYTMADEAHLMVIPVGAFADPNFPQPAVSVYEERMHVWVQLPAGVEHVRCDLTPINAINADSDD